MENDSGKTTVTPGVDDGVINENAMAQQGHPEKEAPAAPQSTGSADGPLPGINTLNQAAKLDNLDFVLDIPMMLTVELGRSQMLINELLKLGRGSVIEMSKLAGEPLDILANQRLIARGEVVVVNEKYGIRITEIISPAERVEKLR